MRVPGNIARTVNVYLAFRAALAAVLAHNERSTRPITTLLVPGLGTGVGKVPPTRAAKQMKLAHDAVLQGVRMITVSLRSRIGAWANAGIAPHTAASSIASMHSNLAAGCMRTNSEPSWGDDCTDMVRFPKERIVLVRCVCARTMTAVAQSMAAWKRESGSGRGEPDRANCQDRGMIPPSRVAQKLLFGWGRRAKLVVLSKRNFRRSETWR